MATKFFCDICEKETKKGNYIAIEIDHVTEAEFYDVCKTCAKRFKELKELLEPEETYY